MEESDRVRRLVYVSLLVSSLFSLAFFSSVSFFVRSLFYRKFFRETTHFVQ